MKLAFTHEHHNASVIWSKRDLLDWITDVFEAPAITIKPHCTTVIRQHVITEFQKEGWAQDVKIDQELGLKVFAMKEDLGFQLQTGNMSRAPYDLLKLQYLFQSGKIEGAALAVPSKACANKIGDNIANAERICKELIVFDRVITVPILVIAFE
ncbi:MAG: hypothetical protein JWR05_208 [Mucilaginibacter sp.]|nr:hypothetical protein [Mucilaginibacter sp.]